MCSCTRPILRHFLCPIFIIGKNICLEHSSFLLFFHFLCKNNIFLFQRYKINIPSFSFYAIEFHSLVCYIIYRLSFETITREMDMVSRALLKYNTQQKHPATAHCGVFLCTASPCLHTGHGELYGVGVRYGAGVSCGSLQSRPLMCS